MDLFVLDTNFNTLGIVDVYNSMIWTDRYWQYGDFELYTAVTQDILDLIKRDYYLWSSHSEHTMIVEDITIKSDTESGNYLTITGRSLESILDRRITWGLRSLSGNFQDAIEFLLRDNFIAPSKPERKVENFKFERSTDPNITGLTINAQYLGENVYDIIQKSCEQRGIGFKITLNNQNQLVFKLYAGTDRSYNQTAVPYVIFSSRFDNILNSNYMESKSSLKNVTLVGGEGEGDQKRYTAVGNTSGLARREIYTDASGLSSETEEDMTTLFLFNRYNQVYNIQTNSIVSEPNFNSTMTDISAYAGRSVRMSVPKYTAADGSSGKYGSVFLNSSQGYVSRIRAWQNNGNPQTVDSDEDDPETGEPIEITIGNGALESFEFQIPANAKYIYTSMFNASAISSGVYSGETTDFEFASTKISNSEYVAQLRQKGFETLADYGEVVSFEGEAETSIMFRYGEHFDIGDIVQVTDEYGHEALSRVVEVVASEDESGTALYPTFTTIPPENNYGVLPDGYTELGYIQSSGTQYIDTGFKHNQNTRVVMDAMMTGATANAWLFEGRTSSAANAKGVFFYQASGQKFNADYSATSQSRHAFTSVALTDRLGIDYDHNTCTINSETHTFTAASFQSPYNLTLFACNTAGTIAGYATMRLYSCQIYDNGELIRDFVPCTNDQNEVGLYDLVNEQFYHNFGSGEFTAGAKGV